MALHPTEMAPLWHSRATQLLEHVVGTTSPPWRSSHAFARTIVAESCHLCRMSRPQKIDFGEEDHHPHSHSGSGSRTTGAHPAGDSSHLSNFHQFGQIDVQALAPALGMGRFPAFPLFMHSRVICYLTGSATSTAAGYLFESDLLKKRSFVEEMCFYTGTSYLSGVFLGGTFGFFEGVKKARELDTTVRKLRVNAILNGISRRGPTLGSNLGVLGMA